MRRFIYRSLRLVSALDHWLRERLTYAGWLALGMAGASAAAGLDTNQTVTYRAFTFLVALLALSWLASLLFSRLLAPRLEASRELPRYATAGERCDYRVVLVNRGARAFAGASVQERFRDPRPGFEEWRRAREPGEERRNWWDRTVGYFRWRWLIDRRLPREAVPGELARLAPGERRELRLSFTPRRRGRIEMAGLTVGRPDPLGLVRGLARLPLEARLVALPRRYRLPELVLPGRRKYQQGGVSLAASVGDSEEFLALRDYRPGDPLQRVHWKSYARTGKPVVKDYQDEFFERHALVLDTGSAGGEDAAFEDAVALAASFVYTIDTHECLLDLLFVAGGAAGTEAAPAAKGGVRTYTAGRGQMQAGHMLEVLAAVSPSDRAEFAGLSRAIAARRESLSSVILILLAWDEERRKLAAALQGSGAEVRALLVCAKGARPGASSEPLPGWISVLHAGEIEKGLAGLR
ncbi:MAG TPA: DUF58 domain-containing protein [Burkholderiales bacterium]|nr:DUF58 domain-containing protein [Burkholderiales bacterium]